MIKRFLHKKISYFLNSCSIVLLRKCQEFWYWWKGKWFEWWRWPEKWKWLWHDNQESCLWIRRKCVDEWGGQCPDNRGGTVRGDNRNINQRVINNQARWVFGGQNFGGDKFGGGVFGEVLLCGSLLHLCLTPWLNILLMCRSCQHLQGPSFIIVFTILILLSTLENQCSSNQIKSRLLQTASPF